MWHARNLHKLFCQKKQGKKCDISAYTTKLRELETKLCEAIILQNSEQDIQDIEDKIRSYNKAIEDKVEEETRAAAIRSKCNWYEAGDTSSKMFLNLEKSRANQKCIRRLKTGMDKIITDPKEILQEEFNFYSKLYTSNNANKKAKPSLPKEADLFKTTSPKITEESFDDLTRDLEESEIWEIIQNSPRNKSPGIDCFTTEFYAEFWPQLKEHMLAAYKEALERGYLTTTQRRGIISLIPKPQKDMDMLKNAAKPGLQVPGKSNSKHM